MTSDYANSSKFQEQAISQVAVIQLVTRALEFIGKKDKLVIQDHGCATGNLQVIARLILSLTKDSNVTFVHSDLAGTDFTRLVQNYGKYALPEDARRVNHLIRIASFYEKNPTPALHTYLSLCFMAVHWLQKKPVIEKPTMCISNGFDWTPIEFKEAYVKQAADDLHDFFEARSLDSTCVIVSFMVFTKERPHYKNNSMMAHLVNSFSDWYFFSKDVLPPLENFALPTYIRSEEEVMEGLKNQTWFDYEVAEPEVHMDSIMNALNSGHMDKKTYASIITAAVKSVYFNHFSQDGKVKKETVDKLFAIMEKKIEADPDSTGIPVMNVLLKKKE